MPGFATLGQTAYRLIFGAGVILRALVQGDRQDDTDQTGPGGTHVEPRNAEAERLPLRLIFGQDRSAVFANELIALFGARLLALVVANEVVHEGGASIAKLARQAETLDACG